MKAVLIRAHGGPEAVVVEDLPDPRPGPGEARRGQELLAERAQFGKIVLRT